MELNKRINRHHTLLLMMYQALAAIVYGFGIFMMMSRGFDSVEAGLVLSACNLLSVCVQPLISNFLDNSKKFNLFQMIILVCSFFTVLFIANAFIVSRILILPIICSIAFGLFSSIEPLLNSISQTFTSNGINVEYSTARALGSATYGIFCGILGKLSVIDFRYVLFGGVIFSMTLTLLALLINKDFKDSGIILKKDNQEKTISFLEFVKNHKNYTILCIFLTGILLGYTCIDNFSLLVVERVGGDSSNMGMLLCIKALVEVIGIYIFTQLVKKIEIEKLLSFMAICFVAKSLCTYFATSVFELYLCQLIQIISFGFVIPGMVSYASMNMSENEAIRGQAFFTMAIVLGSTFSSLIGGIIANNYGTGVMELFSCGVQAISAIGYIIMLRKKD